LLKDLPVLYGHLVLFILLRYIVLVEAWWHGDRGRQVVISLRCFVASLIDLPFSL
jgi:hypothetical protein